MAETHASSKKKSSLISVMIVNNNRALQISMCQHWVKSLIRITLFWVPQFCYIHFTDEKTKGINKLSDLPKVMEWATELGNGGFKLLSNKYDVYPSKKVL